MKVDPRAVEGVRLKIARAHDHLELLDREWETFRRREPYRLVHEVHANGAKHLYRVRLDEPIPIMWSVILGEIIHDLRFALDQAVYWLIVDNTGAEQKGSAFPVFTRRRAKPAIRKHKKMNLPGFDPDGKGLIKGIGTGPAAFIERLQPYAQRSDPLTRSILNLQDFWNHDKHRLVHLIGLVPSGESQLRITKPPGRCKTVIFRGVLHDRAIVMRSICDPPAPDMEMSGKIDIDIGIKTTGKERRRAPVTLGEMFWNVAGVVARLLDAVGRPNERIPLDPFPNIESWVKPGS